MSVKDLIPWYARIASKMILSRMPVPYSMWHRLHLYRHGAMLDHGYAQRVFDQHLAKAGVPDLRGKTLLELGPGDSLLTAVFARQLGATRTILVDAGRFAADDLSVYQMVARKHAVSVGSEVLRPDEWSSLSDMLADCRATYLCSGLESLKTLAGNSIDISFSQAVLEHVHLKEFEETMSELCRVAIPGGVSLHQVDLRDHLGGALNNLRFSEATWEGALFARSGFYTNRLRMKDILGMMASAGFLIKQKEPRCWDSLPTPRSAMDRRFRDLPYDELRVFDFFVHLLKP
jgi:SAM-dependent methyltransferase